MAADNTGEHNSQIRPQNAGIFADHSLSRNMNFFIIADFQHGQIMGPTRREVPNYPKCSNLRFYRHKRLTTQFRNRTLNGVIWLLSENGLFAICCCVSA